MIQNGPKTDANVCVDSAIQADNQICRARSARYFLEQSLVLAHTEFRYVILLLTSPVTQEAGNVGARPFFFVCALATPLRSRSENMLPCGLQGLPTSALKSVALAARASVFDVSI